MSEADRRAGLAAEAAIGEAALAAKEARDREALKPLKGERGDPGEQGPPGRDGRDGRYVVSSAFLFDHGRRLDGRVDTLSDGTTRTLRIVRDQNGRPIGLRDDE